MFKRQGIPHVGMLCFIWPALTSGYSGHLDFFIYNAIVNNFVPLSLCTQEKLFISLSGTSCLFKLMKHILGIY